MLGKLIKVIFNGISHKRVEEVRMKEGEDEGRIGDGGSSLGRGVIGEKFDNVIIELIRESFDWIILKQEEKILWSIAWDIVMFVFPVFTNSDFIAEL